MRTDFLELADVLALARRRRRQRPQLLDVLAADVEEAGADRRQQPLVQRRAVVVALEIAQREREVREGVRAVDDGLDAAAARHPRDVADREQLPGEVRDVAEVDDLRLRRERALEALPELADVPRRHRERELRERDLVAPNALLPRVEHAPVILVRRQHFVAGVEVEAELRDLQRLAGVARNRELLRIAARLGRELPPYRLDVWFEEVPHVVDWRLVGDVQVPL